MKYLGYLKRRDGEKTMDWVNRLNKKRLELYFKLGKHISYDAKADPDKAHFYEKE